MSHLYAADDHYFFKRNVNNVVKFELRGLENAVNHERVTNSRDLIVFVCVRDT